MRPTVSPNPGYLSFVLHGHLPYVRHPEHEFFVEEEWLFEALTECYIPLLVAFERLQRDVVPFSLSLVLSPTLISMLDDALLRQRYRRHLDGLRQLIRKELLRTRADHRLQQVVQFYAQRLDLVEQVWRATDGDIIGAFARLQTAGHLDLMTCAATHGYLPLLRHPPHAVRAQLTIAVEHYQHRFGRRPRGIWLPECGYYPGLEQELRRLDLRYFVVDTHAFTLARPKPPRGYTAPVFTEAGVAAFARDAASSVDVWSREVGYPCDPHYRDFYRDIGYELRDDQLTPLFRQGEARRPSSLKYWAITGDTDEKRPYQPEQAMARAKEHAADFVDKRLAALRQQPPAKVPPQIVAPYDAELFGHWWFEGPWWLEAVFRTAAQCGLKTIALQDYLRAHHTHAVAAIAESSWGENGYNDFWLNESNAWIYPQLHHAAEQMRQIAAHGVRHRQTRPLAAQAARELLLAQASDWAFIIKSNTVVEYAVTRTRNHLARFNELGAALAPDGTVSAAFRLERLDEIAALSPIFPALDPQVYL
ncbi:MAG: DUF1957 domain-containing protein [Deltaproteobacteria bacterium]|nr:DUF1957 domain-containing protein [Deltaproteobacteria bacterium]